MTLFTCRRLGAALGILAVVAVTGCRTTVPITTAAMPGNDVRIASPVAMPLWRVPRQDAPVDVGCRVTEVDGRAQQVRGDTVWIAPVTWWRAEAGARPRCEQLGTSAFVVLPDSAVRKTSAFAVDQKRTGILVGSFVGTILLILGGIALIIASLAGRL